MGSLEGNSSRQIEEEHQTGSITELVMDLPLFPQTHNMPQPELNAARNVDVSSVAATERVPVDTLWSEKGN